MSFFLTLWEISHIMNALFGNQLRERLTTTLPCFSFCSMATQTIPITSREQWLLLRRADVTANPIGALFGDDCHPYRTIASLHAEKTGTNIPGPDPDSEVIERGTELEPFVAAKVAKLRPEWAVTKADHYLRDPDARIGCTPDYYIDGPRGRGVLQCKTVGSPGESRAKWGERDAPRPPCGSRFNWRPR